MEKMGEIREMKGKSVVELSQAKTKRVVRNTCGEGGRKRVKTDRRVMEWF